MKKGILGLMIVFLLSAASLYAADGDLIVNGNVGIGTTNPDSLLNIVAPNQVPWAFSIRNNTFASTEAGAFRMYQDDRGVTHLYNNNHDVLDIDSAGNVGIGTTSPGYVLDIAGLDGGDFGVNVSNTNRWAYVNHRFMNNLGSIAYVGIGGSGVEGAYANRAYMDTWTPSAGLSLIASAGDVRFYFGGYLDSNEKIRITSSGKVGIGTTSPTYQLQLSTDSAAKPGSSAWTVASDARLKSNIQPYTKGLKEIVQINPVSYQYNGKGGMGHAKACAGDPATATTSVANGGMGHRKGGSAPDKCVEKDLVDAELLSKTYVGVLAQDIQAVVPETVTSHKGKIHEDDKDETDLLDFDSHALTFILINAVKELKAEIDSLNQQIADLKAQVK